MIASRSRSPLNFFLLVFALSIPFWLAGARTGRQLLPGVPVAAFMFICPAIAALICVYRENRTAGVTALLKRFFDYSRIGAKIWYAPILLLMPGVMLLSFGLMRLLGVPLPTPQFTFLTVITMSLAFFAGALCEELGWSGYVIDPMQDRWGAFRAGVLLGLVWAAWHVIPLMQAHRSSPWIAWWCLGTVTTRVLMVWLYNNTGRSVFGAALFHASLNVAWQLFPIHGSEYDPRVTGLIVAVAAAFVTIVYGPRTLTGYKNT